MRKIPYRGREGPRCGPCGGELCPGESYWQINGELVCAACLPEYARGELEPFRRVLGEEVNA
ncbi:hypothetical protein [Oscillibacter sp.]|uniref:hypothetical protein n=1 Tax=Oscillibacter sp. TaxID=1945593 RepID=UPI0028A2D1E2|nr:hypothetical protein [Oscillibacter sp.]